MAGSGVECNGEETGLCIGGTFQPMWGYARSGPKKAFVSQSAAVSVAVQNWGEDSTQPVGKSMGKATRGSEVPGKGGRMMASLGMSFGCTQIW